MPLRRAKFHMNRCNESPLQGENADFWPLGKNNTGTLPFRGILPVITEIKSTLTAMVLAVLKKYCK